MASGAAKRYAQAVFELAREKGNLDQWSADLAGIAQVMSDERAAAYVANPNVSQDQKIQLFAKALPSLQAEAQNLLKMLLHRDRMDDAEEIHRLFTEAVLEERGIAVADVTTAEPLSPEAQEAVRRQLSRLVGRNVELRLHQDPSIIGGIIARVGDQLIDGSVINQLRRLRARLVQPA